MNSNTLFYTRPAEYWTEALPLGNGFIGAMCYSGVKDDKISLNHDTLWTGHPRTVKREGACESYHKAQKMVFDGEYRKAHKELEHNFLACWSQAYMPFGDIDIEFDITEFADYKRTLDLKNAILTSEFTCDTVRYKKTAFVSNPADAMVYRIEADKNVLSFTLSASCQLRSNIYVENDTLIIDGECPSDADTYSDSYPCNSLIYSDNDNERGIQFRGTIRIDSDGDITAKNGTITVKNASVAAIYFTAKSSFNGFDKFPATQGREYKQSCLNALDGAVKAGYEVIKNEHIADYRKFYDRVELTLGGASGELLPTDERLLRFRDDKSDLSLYTLLFNFGRYLLISSSREGSTATNLQGIWNNSIKPPWNSNYTVNINTQMNYWCALMCNMPELMTPLVDLVKTASVTGESTARDFYNARGFVIHHNMDIWGHTAPVKGSPVWAYWQGASGWLCRSLYEIYEYTLDEEYLSETALPIMKKAAEFYLDILVDDGNGNLIISPATSPENCFATGIRKSAVAKSTAMMNSIVLDLMVNCKNACEVLGIEDDFYKSVCNAAEKILPLQIGKKGEILEWNEPLRETEVHHRHVSHLYALHPAGLITQKDKELIEACRKTLKIRGDDGTGWSLAWKINFWARLWDGNHALRLIDKQLRPVPSGKSLSFRYDGGGGTYANLFDAHPPFQIDGNFGSVSGIGEMLMQSDGENIYLLPALPDKWANGCVRGLRARGNVTVDIEWSNNKITDYKIHGCTDGLNIICCR